MLNRVEQTKQRIDGLVKVKELKMLIVGAGPRADRPY